jgi:hypothetical protein
MRLFIATVSVVLLFVQACSKQVPDSSVPLADRTDHVATNAALKTNVPTKEQLEALRRTMAHPLSRDEVAALLRSLVQAEMPTNATDVFGSSRRLFTQVLDIRFTCTPDELRQFLAASPRLQDALRTENRSLLGVANDFSWWHPEKLKNTKGAQQQWKQGMDSVSCDLLVGETEDAKTVTAYLIVVLEASR